MLKRHHKLLLIALGVGVLVLVYLWFKHRSSGASDSTGATDYSSLPAIYSTGGGAIMPSMPNFSPASFDQTSQPISPVSNPGTVTVVPGTSGSGVLQHTPQAMEFLNTNQPIAAPGNPQTAQPSFYASSQDLAAPLPYQQLNSTYVMAKSPGVGELTPQATLASYLGVNLNAAEIQADLAIGNKKTQGVDYYDPEKLRADLTSEGSSYCAQHPEACQGDNASLIQSLVDSYKNFIGAAGARQSAQESASQNPGGIQGPAKTGTPVFKAADATNPLGSWVLAQSTSTPNTTPAPASTPTGSMSGSPQWKPARDTSYRV